MCGKPIWTGFRTLSHSDMIYRAYFRLLEGRFRHFRRPVGKQVFSVIAPAPSFRPSKSGNPLLLPTNRSRSVPLMSAYAYQPVFSLLEAERQHDAPRDTTL
jgi:hypothetical protein